VHEYYGLPGRCWIFIIFGAIFKTLLKCFTSVHRFYCVCELLVYMCQYSETNVMHSLFNLLRIKGLYMFRAILAQPQDTLHKRHAMYQVPLM
jgi:hypothetical protein